jgi:hypothetical protein
VLNGMVWDGHGGGAAREEEERGADEEDAEVDAAQPERQRQGRPRQRVVGAAEHPRPAADVPLYLLLWLPRNGRRPGDRPRPSRRPAAGIPSRRERAGVPLLRVRWPAGWLGFCFNGTSLPHRVVYWAVRSDGGAGLCTTGHGVCLLRTRAAACVHAGAAGQRRQRVASRELSNPRRRRSSLVFTLNRTSITC